GCSSGRSTSNRDETEKETVSREQDDPEQGEDPEQEQDTQKEEEEEEEEEEADTSAIKTFTLDLSAPELSTPQGKRLQLPTKKLLVFKLTNANPYRYTYLLRHKAVDFFQEDDDIFANPKNVTPVQENDSETFVNESDDYQIQATFAASLLKKAGKDFSAKTK